MQIQSHGSYWNEISSFVYSISMLLTFSSHTVLARPTETGWGDENGQNFSGPWFRPYYGCSGCPSTATG